MAEDFLGISAHVDFGEFEDFIQRIVSGLEALGNDTDAVSRQLRSAMDALNNTAGVSDTISKLEHLKSSLDSVAEGTDEYKGIVEQFNALQQALAGVNLQNFSGASVVLSSFKNNIEQQLQTTTSTIERLKEEQAAVSSSSAEYQALSDSIAESQAQADRYVSILGIIKDATLEATEAQKMLSEQIKASSDKQSAITAAVPESSYEPQNILEVPESLKNGWSNFFEVIQNSSIATSEQVEGLFEKVLNQFSEEMPENELVNFISNIQLLFEKLKETVDPDVLTSSLSKFYTEFTPVVDSLEEAYQKVEAAYKKEVETLEKLKSKQEQLSEKASAAVRGNDDDTFQEAQRQKNALSIPIHDVKQRVKEYEEALTQLKTTLDGVNKVSEETAEKSVTLKDAWSGIVDTLKKSRDGFVDWATGHGKAQEAISQFKDALNDMPGPLGGVVSGFKKMTSAAKMFLTTPIGVVLGALVFLLKAFQTWLTKSANGQKVMAQITAYLGSLMESLTDILVKVGEYLYKAFTAGNTPLSDFASNLKNFFVNALKSAFHQVQAFAEGVAGLWDIVKNGAQLNWDGVKAGWDRVKTAARISAQASGEALTAIKEGFKGVGNGVLTAVQLVNDGFVSLTANGGMSAMFSGILDKAETAAKNAKVQLETDQNITAEKGRQLAYDKEIADCRERAKTASREELKNLMEEMRLLTMEKFGEQLDSQKKQLQLLKERNSLHTKSLKDITAEHVLEMQIYTLEEKRLAAARAISRLEERQSKKLDKQEERDRKAQEKQEKASEKQAQRDKAAAQRKAEKEQKAAEREAARLKKEQERIAKLSAKQVEAEYKAASKLSDTINKNSSARVEDQMKVDEQIEEARVNAMKEGAEKRRAMREQEHKKELDEIARNAQERIDNETERQLKEFEDTNAWRKERGEEPLEFVLDTEPIEKFKKDAEELARLQQQIWDIEDMKELSDKYQTYYDKRVEIESKYNEDIERLSALRSKARHAGNKEEVEQLDRMISKAYADQGKALIQNALDQIKEDPAFKKAYEDIGNASQYALKALQQELINAAVKAREAGLDISLFEKEIEKVQEQLSKDAPFTAAQEATEKAEIALETLKRAELELDFIRNGGKIIKGFNIDENGNRVAVYKTEEDAIKRVSDARKKYIQDAEKAFTAQQKVLQVVEKTAKALTDLGSTIGGEVGTATKFIGDVVNFASTGIKSIQTSALEAEKATDAMGKTMAKANMWLAAMSAMFKIVGAVQSLFPTTDKMYQDAVAKQEKINNLRRAVDSYSLAVLDAQRAEKNWFAVSGLTSLTDAYEKHGKVVEQYYKELYAAQAKYHNKSSGLSKATPYLAALAAVAATVVTAGAAAGPALMAAGAALSAGVAGAATVMTAAIAGTIAGSVAAVAQGVINGITYKNGQVAAKDNLKMQTRHKTFFRGEKTQDLSEWVREQLGAELFDKEGLINLEAAQTVLDHYGDKLVGQTKETLERLVNLRKEYNEFMEQVEKYVSDLYSPLVDDMTDALFEWLRTGTDVLYKFRQNAKDTFASIAKDMVKQMLLTMVFDQYKDQLKEIYKAYAISQNEDQLISGVMTATDSFLNQAETELPLIQEALTKINDQFAERGFDLSESSDEGSGAYRSSQSFSQEQGDELNGRLTAIQIGQQQGIVQRTQLIELQNMTFGAVVQIKESFLASSQDISAMRDMQYASLQRLTEISVFCSVLPAMANDISDMRTDIRNKL